MPVAAVKRLAKGLAGAVAALRHAHSWRWLTYGIVVGLAAGLAASAYYVSIEWLQSYLLRHLAGLSLPNPKGEHLFDMDIGAYRPWLVPVFTSLVGIITGFFIQRYVPETVLSGTDGTDATTRVFHRAAGKMAPRVPFIRGLASILTIASGCSAGREGPIAQIGGGIGSWMADKLRLSARERRLLLLAGAAGGLGAIFRAPLGGALTAVEVIYREDFEAEAILPAVMGSATAYSVFSFFFGTEHILSAPAFQFTDPRELAFYAVLAVVCSAAGYFFVGTFRACKTRVFAPLRERLGIMWTLGLGGLLAGSIGAVFPQALSGGYGWLEMAILGQVPALMLIAILLGKTLATSVTIGSGMSGGMFAPALMVGGLSGGLVGEAAHALWPNIATQPGSYVLVGMAAFFSGIAKAPIGPLIMVCELSRGYGLLAPLMLSSALCIALCRKVSLYDNQVESKFDSPAHAADATLNVLESHTVGHHYTPGLPPVLESYSTLGVIADLMRNSQVRTFPVRNACGRITGLVDIHRVRGLVFEEPLFDLVVAGEIMGPLASLTPGEDLYHALLTFVESGYAQLPVFAGPLEEAAAQPELLGMLDRRAVFEAYADGMRRVRSLQEHGEVIVSKSAGPLAPDGSVCTL
ncbi:MAG: chloride channel protein [Desulfovibrionaceae bacterium CG1_02_65_16]|nr:MAG: chloride channel protein [Desulfovibrionaceae bacterium CG1_02_65_16]